MGFVAFCEGIVLSTRIFKFYHTANYDANT